MGAMAVGAGLTLQSWGWGGLGNHSRRGAWGAVALPRLSSHRVSMAGMRGRCGAGWEAGRATRQVGPAAPDGRSRGLSVSSEMTRSQQRHDAAPLGLERSLWLLRRNDSVTGPTAAAGGPLGNLPRDPGDA